MPALDAPLARSDNDRDRRGAFGQATGQVNEPDAGQKSQVGEQQGASDGVPSTKF